METAIAILNFLYPFLSYIGIALLILLAFLAGLTGKGINVAKKINSYIVSGMRFLKEGLSENGGGASSKRIFNAYIVMLLVPAIAYVVIHMAKFHPELAYQYFWSALLFIAAVLGIQMAGKKDEIKDPNNNKPDQPAQ